MRAILVNNEPSRIHSFKKMLESNCPEVDMKALSSNDMIAKKKSYEIRPDMDYLNIRTPGKSRLDLSAELPVTNYLMKSVDDNRLEEAVQLAEKRLLQKINGEQTELIPNNTSKVNSASETRLCLPTQKGFTVVKLEEIVYCQAQRSYTQFRLFNNKSITVSKPLFDYDSLLNDTAFLRVHKSFLINLLHVKEYARGEGGTVIMSNGMEIEVSRRRKEQFLFKIKEFFKY
ncbi:MAG TPA: LytTR family transcriptional regulator DNA-binding domain-containing protein [Chitinophagaceae bacterium]|nr:LytTR family transcriptional regulator DNA-binding domain-containing protein [Chitinophagaceae bacterium]